tara:strand:+ start:39 stop:617 length:579 start_codon:yes stop_codon:yes gene_type:complete
MTAQFANGGYKIYPKIVVDKNEDTLEYIKNKMQHQPEENITGDEKSRLNINDKIYKNKNYKALYKNKENIKFVLDAMFRSTNEVYGTSFRSRIDDPKYQFAGKTGTSQVKRITEEERELDLDIEQIPYKSRDHALYIAFAPYKNPRYAISILIEHGGSGGKVAAPIAKKLIKFVIDRHDLRENRRSQNMVNI